MTLKKKFYFAKIDHCFFLMSIKIKSCMILIDDVLKRIYYNICNIKVTSLFYWIYSVRM